MDEFRTSKVCPTCNMHLRSVHVDKTTHRQLRGLLRCQSSKCKNIPFKDRDFVGACNILRCLDVNKRPKCLTRIDGDSDKKGSKQRRYYLGDTGKKKRELEKLKGQEIK